MTTYKRDAENLAAALAELLNDLEDRSAEHPHAVRALELWNVDRVNRHGLYGDPFTDQAALMLENERQLHDAAAEATARAFTAYRQAAEDDRGAIVVLLGDALRKIAETHSEIRAAERFGWGETAVRLWMDHVDWRHYAGLCITEAALQEGVTL